MKKLKIAKWLVLATAIVALVCFATPFTYCNVSMSWSGELPDYAKQDMRISGLYYGFHMIAGVFRNLSGELVDIELPFGVWLTRVSLVIAIAAAVLSVLPLVIKDSNGLNKKGKIHGALWVSVALSVTSALINVVSMLIIQATEGSSTFTMGSSISSIRTTYHTYSYLGFILVISLAIAAAVVCTKAKADLVKANVIELNTGTSVKPNGQNGKYNVTKWLVLMVAIIAVLCFFTPFAYRHPYTFNGQFGIIYGFNFIIGESSDASIVTICSWVVRISLIVAVAAMVFAVLPFASKCVNGLNKNYEFHKSLIVSIALSLTSAIMNFIPILVGSVDYTNTFQEFYTFIGLIVVAVFAVIIAAIFLKTVPEISGMQEQALGVYAANAIKAAEEATKAAQVAAKAAEEAKNAEDSVEAEIAAKEAATAAKAVEKAISAVEKAVKGAEEAAKVVDAQRAADETAKVAEAVKVAEEAATTAKAAVKAADKTVRVAKAAEEERAAKAAEEARLAEEARRVEAEKSAKAAREAEEARIAAEEAARIEKTAEPLAQEQTLAPAPMPAAQSNPTQNRPAVEGVKQQVKTQRVEGVTMKKRDAEGLFAYIWIREYNTLPFDEAFEKIKWYLEENNFPISSHDVENLIANLWVRQYNVLPFDEAIEKITSYLVSHGYIATPETEAAVVVVPEASTPYAAATAQTPMPSTAGEVPRKKTEKRERVATAEANVTDAPSKKESYFKRVKKPISSAEEATPIIKETKKYFYISLAPCLVLNAVGAFVPGIIGMLFNFLGIVAFAPVAYFGIMWYVLKRVVKRFKNMHCSECGAEFFYDENTVWRETNRKWRMGNGKSSSTGTLYVTVQISCVCPECGARKTFTETLCSGKIQITDYAIRNSLVSTQSLIDDYFNGLIHG